MTEAPVGLIGERAKQVRPEAWRELGGLIRAVFDASSHIQAQDAFRQLAAHRRGKELARPLGGHLDEVMVHLLEDNPGLGRTNPEWLWRDFRLRVSHGRNQGSDLRLERSARLCAVYHNFEPAHERGERKRSGRHPGRAPLAVAGVPPNGISYLDALSV